MNYLKTITWLFIIPAITFSSAFGAPRKTVKICPQKRPLNNPITTAQKRVFLEVNQQDEDGNTELHRTIMSYCPPEEVPAILNKTADLIRRGADLLLKNNDDKNCLDIIIDQLKLRNDNIQYIKEYKYRINAVSKLLGIEIPQVIAEALDNLENKIVDVDINELCSDLKNLFSGGIEVEPSAFDFKNLDLGD
ncbi:hypothetical protein JST56_03140 [Candidatus Dependentiae bacterium]|jgi:hypothetical protein|nr:hypothetical protein [Candidatus Dependentiae bacterium]